MSGDDSDLNKSNLHDLLSDLDIGTSRPVEAFKEVKTNDDYTDRLYADFNLPTIGKQRSEFESHLIEAGEWGFFDTVTNQFVNDVDNLSLEAFKDVLRVLTWLGADELFMQESEPLKMKLQSEVWPITKQKYSLDEIDSVIGEATNPGIPARIRSGSSQPFALSVPWLNSKNEIANIRFRGNGVKTIGTKGSKDGVTYCIRKLGDKVPTLDDLKVQPKIRGLAFPAGGIVFTVGETGSGKSTLNVAILEHIITTRREVLATYEYPVEFDLREIPNKKAIVGQTDLSDALQGSYSEACKDAMRRNANVLLIGEVRDLDSAEGVLNLAQSGHIVYCTFHAGSPMEVFSRIISYFPSDNQNRIRQALIGAVQAIICVKLIPTSNGKRVQIRGHLGLNNSSRKKLYSVKPDDFNFAVAELYEKSGRTMGQDLLSYKDQIDEDVFESYMHQFEDSEDPNKTNTDTNTEIKH